MRTIKLAELEIPESRQRRDFAPAAQEELRKDIELRGLMHAIVVSFNSETSSYKLVAGERRCRAITEMFSQGKNLKHDGRDLEVGLIPIVLLGTDVSEIEHEEAELAENIVRTDLSWQERTAAFARLHKLRGDQNPNQTVKATAQEIAKRQNREATSQDSHNVSRATIIAGFLDDADVVKAPNETAAFRIASKKLEEMFASKIKKVAKPSQVHTLHHGDMSIILKELPASMYSVVVTDPPYGIGVDKFGSSTTIKHDYSEKDVEKLHAHLIAGLTRVCKPDAHAYVFCAVQMYEKIKKMFEIVEWRVRPAPLIWSKGNLGHLPEGGATGYKRSYEIILHASRGGKKYANLVSDLITGFPSQPGKLHAAEKPIGLYQYLLAMSAVVGEEVLDPFAGSGPIFPAADKLSLIATGIEMSAESVMLIEQSHGVYRKKMSE